MVAPRPPLQPTLALVGELLAEQQRLQTPVARFSSHLHAPGPALEPVYRDLIPLSVPGPGEQYAFEVDLDACSGCKACVAGCHSLNGLDEHETWRDVGLLVGDDPAHPFQQTVTAACHHCADPACLNGCPVLAYEKDPHTGIVRHLDDQCIGCSYCILKCPYDVPKFSARLGIVRKCDLCHGRLSAGEAPACVQACPTHAIRVVAVPAAPAALAAPPPPFLPGAPDPAYTRPTTRYVSRRGLPARIRAADANALRPAHAHWALVFLLTFTQAGYGLLTAAALGAPTLWPGLALVGAGLVASVAHLGQPLRAWRVFLGLRRSWLSREAVVLGASAGALGLHVVTGRSDILWAGLALGYVGVACSVMIYVDTRRRFWRLPPSTARMAGTVAVAALLPLAPAAAAVALLLKAAVELLALRGPGVSARLLRGPLRHVFGARLAAALIAVATLGGHAPAFTVVVWLLGELAERYLYFTAVDTPKMPGTAAT